MQKIGYLFPGQGSQYVGMGRDLYEKYPAAKAVFDKANAVLGFNLKKICFEGPKEELARTDISQPAILTMSMAALRAWENVRVSQTPRRPDAQIEAVAGLSLGEYSALVSAGVIAFEDAVRLVRKRGEFMQLAAEKNKGTMVSVLGLSIEDVNSICKEAGVQAANLNSPGQTVVSGLIDDINKAVELVRKKPGAKAIILDVSGPFHSKFMESAGIMLKKELENIKMSAPKFPVVANVTAKHQTDTAQIKKNLIDQVSNSVLWEDSMRLMIKGGITNFFEIGPGAVLKGLARRIDADIRVYNIGKVQDIEEFCNGNWRHCEDPAPCNGAGDEAIS